MPRYAHGCSSSTKVIENNQLIFTVFKASIRGENTISWYNQSDPKKFKVTRENFQLLFCWNGHSIKLPLKSYFKTDKLMQFSDVEVSLCIGRRLMQKLTRDRSAQSTCWVLSHQRYIYHPFLKAQRKSEKEEGRKTKKEIKGQEGPKQNNIFCTQEDDTLMNSQHLWGPE